MAITYPLALPSGLGVASIRLTARGNTGGARSPFTFSQQFYEHAGQVLEADVRVKPMKRGDAEAIVSWLLALNGRAGTFLMGDGVNKAFRGAGGGTPVVNGAHTARSRTLAIRGCPISTTAWARAGDMIQLGSGSSAHLHKILVDVDTNGSGQATLDLWPTLRAAYADGSAIVITNTVGAWRLASNETSWDVGLALMYGIAFTAEEDLVA